MFAIKSNNLNKIQHKGITYYIASSFAEKHYKYNFEEIDDELIELAVPGKHRSVHLSKKINAVVKRNILKSFRRRLYTHFGVQGFFGRFSLVDEYRNLMALSHLDFIPKVYAFGVCSSFPVKEECLVIEYYEGALTADEMIQKYPSSKALILENIFLLFLKAWEGGFAHIDPNPGNILFLSFSELKFIDLEGCFLGAIDKEFYFGFAIGTFYYYWFSKYVDESYFFKILSEFIFENAQDLDFDIFHAYYHFFKANDVSRREKIKLFKSRSERNKLVLKK